MVSIREELGDVLEPDDEEEEETSEIQQETSLSYPIHYSQGSRGNWTALNFSEPYGKRQLIPDYTAQRLYRDEDEVWEVSTDEETVEVNVDSGIENKDKLADELKTSYHEKI